MRDAGLIMMGFLVGYMAACASLGYAAQHIEETDRLMRALRLRYGTRRQGDS